MKYLLPYWKIMVVGLHRAANRVVYSVIYYGNEYGNLIGDMQRARETPSYVICKVILLCNFV